MRSSLVAIALLAALPAAAGAQLAADTAGQVDQVFKAFNRTDVPGCVVGIDRGGKALYRRAYGMANLETGSPLTVESVVESGSVAKQFTAGAIVLLALQGKLDLDDPVRKYLTHLPEYGTPVTIRMLLHHTSGIRDMWTLFVLAGKAPGTVLYTMDEALQMVYRQKELNFPPNTQYLYSNSGFLLLAEIVQQVSDIPLSQFSREQFFEPLGMTSTQWRDDWNRIIPRRTTAYAPDSSGGFRIDMPYMNVYGAGGLLTTVDDLARWTAHLDHPVVGGKRWADTLQHRGRLADGKEINYGLALAITNYRDTREISHSGSTGGYRTFLARWPEHGLSLALLCNAANAATVALGHQVADLFLGTDRAATGSGSGTGPTTRPPEPTIPPLAAGELAALAGSYYSGELDASYRVAAGDEGLTIAVGGNGPRPFRRTGPDEFKGVGGVEVRFTRNRQGRPTGFLLSAGRVQNLRFERR